MSVSGQQKVLKPILLRSNTPAPNEKVLKYLEGMSSEEPDSRPPRSLLDEEEYRNRLSSAHSGSPSALSPPAPLPKSPNGNGLEIQAENAEGEMDAGSNVQQGMSSEGGTILPIREPTWHDLPGPKYESYDSGPSFGNLGPLPSDDKSFRMNGQSSSHAAKVPLPDSELAQSPRVTNAGFAQPSSRAASRTGNHVDLPWSPKSGRTKGTAYPPLPESRIGDEETNLLVSPKAKSNVRSKAPSISPSDSPSQFRPPPSAVSRKTAAAKSAAAIPDQAAPPEMMSPRSGSRMQPLNGAGLFQASSSVMSPSHQSRPFSPYRHAPTTEDLLHAAVRGRSFAIPEESERTSSVIHPPEQPQSRISNSKAPSQMSKSPSQSAKSPSQLVKSPSQLVKSPSQLAKSSSHLPDAPSQISKAPSQHYAKTPSQINKSLSHPNGVSMPPSARSSQKGSPSAGGSKVIYPPYGSPITSSHRSVASNSKDGELTPRPHTPQEDLELEAEEARIVEEALASRTPRTSYYAAPLESEVAGPFHDAELCVLLRRESDPNEEEPVKRALRKAIRQRVKKLGMKYDWESIKQYRKMYHDHDPSVHLHPGAELPPPWVADVMRQFEIVQHQVESLGPKIDDLHRSMINDSHMLMHEEDGEHEHEQSYTPRTQSVNMQAQPMNSTFTGVTLEADYDELQHGDHHHHHHHLGRPGYATSEVQDHSGGQQVLREEIFKLRQRPQGSQSDHSHNTWEVAREQDLTGFEEEQAQTIPDDGEVAGTVSSPPLPPVPVEEDGEEEGGHEVEEADGEIHLSAGEAGPVPLTPWQRIHARLLSWAVNWPMSVIDQALNSTTRGQQVDEIALSVWTAQTYKRYVRARLTDSPPGIVDRLFIPPNMADAISNAVFNGQHGNACGMLRYMWEPFGLPNMPRLLVVLAKHRSEDDHWVVHRYCLPEGSLVTYDSYSGRTLMDGRPLGWWFAIQIAWPNCNYPSPDHLEQKMVRLHRPLQLPIDNSVAAAGIWRNILMGSRGERSLDLERLRDLINTEVRNLRQRKLLGRLSMGPPR